MSEYEIKIRYKARIMKINVSSSYDVFLTQIKSMFAFSSEEMNYLAIFYTNPNEQDYIKSYIPVVNNNSYQAFLSQCTNSYISLILDPEDNLKKKKIEQRLKDQTENIPETLEKGKMKDELLGSKQQMEEMKVMLKETLDENKELKDKTKAIEESSQLSSSVLLKEIAALQNEVKVLKQNQYIETNAKKDLIEHKNIKCSNCEIKPIKGIRFKCSQCANINLCNHCFNHRLKCKHTFYAITDPNEFNEDLFKKDQNVSVIQQSYEDAYYQYIELFGDDHTKINIISALKHCKGDFETTFEYLNSENFFY